MIVVSNDHLHHDKEFYYVSSLEEAEKIINYFGEVIDKAIEEFDDDYIKLQDMYIQSDIIIELNDKTINKVQKTIRGRSRSPGKEKTNKKNGKLDIRDMLSNENHNNMTEDNMMEDNMIENNMMEDNIIENNMMEDNISSGDNISLGDNISPEDIIDDTIRDCIENNILLDDNILDDTNGLQDKKGKKVITKIIYDNHKNCEDDDYNKFIKEGIIRRQKTKYIHRKFKEWCIYERITNIPNELELLKKLKEKGCEIIVIDNVEYIFVPKKVNDKKEWGNEIIDFINYNFEITGNDRDYVSVADINDIILKNSINKSYIIPKFKNLGIYQDKKNNVRCYMGLKKKCTLE